jgi:hypothetical protein
MSGNNSVQANLERQPVPDVDLYRSYQLCDLSGTCGQNRDLV